MSLKVGFAEAEPLASSSFADHYHVSLDQRLGVDLTALMMAKHNDPAFKVLSFFFSRILVHSALGFSL